MYMYVVHYTVIGQGGILSGHIPRQQEMDWDHYPTDRGSQAHMFNTEMGGRSVPRGKGKNTHSHYTGGSP